MSREVGRFTERLKCVAEIRTFVSHFDIFTVYVPFRHALLSTSSIHLSSLSTAASSLVSESSFTLVQSSSDTQDFAFFVRQFVFGSSFALFIGYVRGMHLPTNLRFITTAGAVHVTANGLSSHLKCVDVTEPVRNQTRKRVTSQSHTLQIGEQTKS